MSTDDAAPCSLTRIHPLLLCSVSIALVRSLVRTRFPNSTPSLYWDTMPMRSSSVWRAALVALVLAWAAAVGPAAVTASSSSEQQPAEYAYVTHFVDRLTPETSLVEVEAAAARATPVASVARSAGAAADASLVPTSASAPGRKPTARLAAAAQQMRFQRVEVQLPPGVDGDGHHERMMAIVHEILDMDNHSKGYKGHVNQQGQLCPGCEPILYNHDSPLSDNDLKLMRAQHAELHMDHIKLVSQTTLDDAKATLARADVTKQELLDRYPARQEGGINGYEEGGQVEQF